jgi:hypothetical protein
MTMPNYAIWFGRLLVLVGIIGYAYGMYNGNASLTALIPAVFGIVLMVLGHISQAKEPMRKLLMHVAMLLGALGFLLPAGRLLSKIGEISMNAAVISQIAMAAICLIFVILGIRSFIDARRSD